MFDIRICSRRGWEDKDIMLCFGLGDLSDLWTTPKMKLSWKKKAVLLQRWAISGSNESLQRYGHSKLSKMVACRQLGFDVTWNSAIWSADPENATLEPNVKCIGSPVAEIWQFAYLGAYGTPILEKGDVIGGQRWQHLKERWRFLIGSALWPLRYLWPLGRNLWSNVSTAHINRVVGHFGPKFLGVPLGVDPWCWGLQRANALH